MEGASHRLTVGKMMAQYQASSLNDIADHFDKLARFANLRRVGVKTQREGHVLLAEANTWKQAASMLRDTKLVSE